MPGLQATSYENADLAAGHNPAVENAHPPNNITQGELPSVAGDGVDVSGAIWATLDIATSANPAAYTYRMFIDTIDLTAKYQILSDPTDTGPAVEYDGTAESPADEAAILAGLVVKFDASAVSGDGTAIAVAATPTVDAHLLITAATPASGLEDWLFKADGTAVLDVEHDSQALSGFVMGRVRDNTSIAVRKGWRVLTDHTGRPAYFHADRFGIKMTLDVRGVDEVFTVVGNVGGQYQWTNGSPFFAGYVRPHRRTS